MLKNLSAEILLLTSAIAFGRGKTKNPHPSPLPEYMERG
jgi:hypothetical protein